MRRIVVALCLLIAAFGSTVAVAGTQDFTLVNRTGLTIQELYISASTTDDWEEDVLGVDVLADGESVEITFSPKEKAATWDLKVVDSEGDSIVWEDLNLNDISRVTLHYGKDGAVADIE